MKRQSWQDIVQEPDPDQFAGDFRMLVHSPEIVNFIREKHTVSPQSGNSFWRKEYHFLKSRKVDLMKANLTDRQLQAVCLVFYGGIPRVRAACVMNISHQALRNHLEGALKKIHHRLMTE